MLITRCHVFMSFINYFLSCLCLVFKANWRRYILCSLCACACSFLLVWLIGNFCSCSLRKNSTVARTFEWYSRPDMPESVQKKWCGGFVNKLYINMLRTYSQIVVWYVSASWDLALSPNPTFRILPPPARIPALLRPILSPEGLISLVFTFPYQVAVKKVVQRLAFRLAPMRNWGFRLFWSVPWGVLAPLHVGEITVNVWYRV
jgi:hypothetical protein